MSCPSGKSNIMITQVNLDGHHLTALLDSGCSVTLIKASAVGDRHWLQDKPLQLEMANGQMIATQGRVNFESVICDGVELGSLEAHVVPCLPCGVQVVIGLPLMLRHGCWIGEMNGQTIVRWGPKVSSGVAVDIFAVVDSRVKEVDATVPGHQLTTAMSDSRLEVEDKDYLAWFEDGVWNVKWKWRPGCLPMNGNRKCYSIKEEARDGFDKEVTEWIKEGVLVEWNLKIHGAVKHRVPLMAVIQRKGVQKKVRPVLDFRQLNDTIENRPGGSTPLCRQRLRDWRKKGPQCAVVDLRKAYLQVRVDPSLWCYQAVDWHGSTFLLTRLGFGLCIAPKVMTAIVTTVLQRDVTINMAASGYIDDIHVQETIVKAEDVVQHLKQYGLIAKEPERLGDVDGVRILGLHVGEDMAWRRDSPVPEVPVTVMSRRDVHRLIGEWLGHYPVCNWLRMSCAYLQRCTSQDGAVWDAAVSKVVMDKVRDVDARLRSYGDPVGGKWPVAPTGEVTLWTDASNLAIGVVIEVDGDCVEDACWLRKAKETSHINVAELDAVIEGINMAVGWQFRHFTVACDSTTVCGWLRSVLDRTHNVRIHALGELLIRRRLDILRQIVEQENLVITVRQVSSAENRADCLTRVPKRWLFDASPSFMNDEPGLAAVGVVEKVATSDELIKLHCQHHFGVNRSLEIAREKYGNDVSRNLMKKVVANCDECARFDPAIRNRWSSGHVTTGQTWYRLAADITYVQGTAWLSVIDCCSGYTWWFQLTNESARAVKESLQTVFSTMSAPKQLLTDNDTIFRSKELMTFLKSWCVESVCSSAYRSQGNGVVERVHRTIKRMAARTNNSVTTCVFWYNVTRGERKFSPYELVFGVKPRIPGVREYRQEIDRPSQMQQEPVSDALWHDNNPFVVGNNVYLKPPSKRCDVSWSGPHRVTSIKSGVTVELNGDGVTRHVSHLRKVPTGALHEQPGVLSSTESDSDSDSDVSNGDDVVRCVSGAPNGGVELRRSARLRERQAGIKCVGCLDT